jgi:hypothetical protein
LESGTIKTKAGWVEVWLFLKMPDSQSGIKTPCFNILPLFLIFRSYFVRISFVYRSNIIGQFPNELRTTNELGMNDIRIMQERVPNVY